MTIKNEIRKIKEQTKKIKEITQEIVNTGHIKTNDKSILKRYGKKHNPEELSGMIKTCSHCGKGKQKRHGRYFSPCNICGKIKKRY